ncbi:hypothetical protein M6D93_05825 [Jatrophihabitans telluris]|uniref:Uncharacterized protein n=1 Tax=Jatrophihabitans telluris TaxID=2038343 RepID=A0ABY4R101_9ACTN|nr:hypothetical protein [Jatrophihabitans telluris]UQX89524.1 hypothetical protein M6D93_05825 [Jatrophihabitans telluris]
MCAAAAPGSSTGPAAAVAHLTVRVPTSVPAGGTVQIESRLHIASDGPRILTGPALARILVMRYGTVVATSTGASAHYLMPLTLSGPSERAIPVLPTSVRLHGCAPDGGASPLPAGQYSVVAVLGYRLDGLNLAPNAPADSGAMSPSRSAPTPDQQRFQLVSDPVTFTIA